MIILMKTTLAYLQSTKKGIESLKKFGATRELETYYEIVYND